MMTITIAREAWNFPNFSLSSRPRSRRCAWGMEANPRSRSTTTGWNVKGLFVLGALLALETVHDTHGPIPLVSPWLYPYYQDYRSAITGFRVLL
jgi:hypothetical protein